MAIDFILVLLFFALGLFLGAYFAPSNESVIYSKQPKQMGVVEKTKARLFKKRAYSPLKDPERRLDGKEFSYFEEPEE